MHALSKLFEALHLTRKGRLSGGHYRRRRQTSRRSSFLSCETLESKQLLAADVAQSFATVELDTTGPVTVAIEGKFQEDTVSGTVVKFDTNAPVSDSDIYIELAANTPLTNANFLSYVNNSAYDNTMFHRSVNNFVLQGGGFTAPTVDANQQGSDPVSIPTTGTVNNEPGNLNTRGTIAMAKLGELPDSATSQFFFNLNNNSFLDSDNGGYTVFGEVLGSGMSVVNTMALAPTYDATTYYANTALGELPLYNTFSDNIIRPNDFLKIENADVVTESDLMTYVVESSDTAKLTASFDSNGDLVLTPVGSATGSVDVTVTATSKLDSESDSQTFSVQLPGPTITPIESLGSTILGKDATGKLYASGSSVLYGGSALTTDRFADRTIVGADTIDGTNYIVFQFTTGSYAGTYRHWAYSANWSAPTGSSWTPTANDSATWAFENAFGINFDGQFGVGTPPTTAAVEAAGDVELRKDASTGALYASGSTVLYGGSALTTDRFADRTIVGADTIDGTNYIVFQFTTGSYAGTYRHWAYSANWSAPTGSSWTPTANDSATWAFENAFGINFDGQFGVGTPPTTAAVEAAGDVELRKDASTGALYASGSTVLYGGSALTTDRFADRTIVGADTIDGTNYIVFQFTTGSYAGTYRHWAYSANWSAPTGSSWTPTANDSATWAFENAFGINFDGQFGVGTPPTTAAVEAAGDVELRKDASTGALYASGSTVLYGGSALTTDRFADRTIVGADTIDGTNYIVFQFTTGSYAGTYRHWAYSANWSAPTGSSWTPTANDSATWAFENAFGINFDGQFGVGTPPTTAAVEAAGDVELRKDASTGALYASGSTVLYGGSALTTDRFADRTIVGADTIDGTNYIVFQFTTGSYAGTYRHWAYSANWSAPTGSSWTPTANDSATWAFENAFGIDFDGFNGIGVPQTPTTSTVETAGDVELARDTTTNALYASGSSVLYGGSALTTDRFADRTIVGADTIDGTNYIVFQFTTGSYAGTYRHWAYNASWSAPTGSSWTPTANDSATWAFENAFGINFDGLNDIGN